MSQKYRLLFVHGWGFSAKFWQPLADLLSDYAIDYIDLGYLNNQKTADDVLQEIKSHQDSYIAIGHSLGFFYLLKQFPLNFHHYVAVNSFLRFTKADDFVSGVPSRILQRMSKGIDKDSVSTLSQFYEQCQYHQRPLSIMNNVRLKEGLDWLEKDDFRHYLLNINDKLTVIASEQDPVVTKEMTCDSFPEHFIQWVEDKTHILPITEPALCATIIKNIS